MVDVHRITVTGEGGPEGGNSAYWLPDRGVLIDPGPPGDAVYERLVDGIEERGDAVGDVETVLLTHWHADHVGAAPALAAAADASIAMHERDAPLLADYAAARERRVARDEATLRNWGVPDEHVDSLLAADAPSPVPDTVAVDRLGDGDVVAGLETVHTPGHTAGHAAYRLDGRVFVGDAVLTTCTPNVGGGDTRQGDPLSAYVRTLGRLEAVGGRAHPGHGAPFALRERVGSLVDHHRERTDSVIEVLDGAGGMTPWEAAEALFGAMSGYHVKFGAGEAFAHLTFLATVDAAERVGTDPAQFSLTVDPGTARRDAGAATQAARTPE